MMNKEMVKSIADDMTEVMGVILCIITACKDEDVWGILDDEWIAWEIFSENRMPDNAKDALHLCFDLFDHAGDVLYKAVKEENNDEIPKL